jgi:hypothetical protein
MFDRRTLKGVLLLGLAGCAFSLPGCSSPSVVSIAITPSTQYFGGPNLTAQLTAIGTFTQGTHPKTTRDITSEVTWKSNAISIATISASGLATSHNGLGSTDVTASMNGFTGLVVAHATITVCPLNANGSACASSN